MTTLTPAPAAGGWDRSTLTGPLTWRDLVVADELRWDARVAEATARATAEDRRDTGPATAGQGYEAADLAREDFARYLGDRTIQSGQSLTDWPAGLLTEAEDQFYASCGYELGEYVTGAAEDEALMAGYDAMFEPLGQEDVEAMDETPQRPVTLYGLDDATLDAETLALDDTHQRVIEALAGGRDPAGVYAQPMGPLTDLQEELRREIVERGLEHRWQAAETLLEDGLDPSPGAGPLTGDGSWIGMDGRHYTPASIGWTDVTHPTPLAYGNGDDFHGYNVWDALAPTGDTGQYEDTDRYEDASAVFDLVDDGAAGW
jgi:hypothetical protein